MVALQRVGPLGGERARGNQQRIVICGLQGAHEPKKQCARRKSAACRAVPTPSRWRRIRFRWKAAA